MSGYTVRNWVKQADVVALIGLLPREFPNGAEKANFRHYEPHCAHGCSLSAGMHARVAARLGYSDMALRYLSETAATDLDLGGVRIAGVGALWQAVILGFAGVDMMDDILSLDPKLPPQWRSLSFRVCWRGRSVSISINDRNLEARLLTGDAMDMRITGDLRKLTANTVLNVALSR